MKIKTLDACILTVLVLSFANAMVPSFGKTLGFLAGIFPMQVHGRDDRDLRRALLQEVERRNRFGPGSFRPVVCAQLAVPFLIHGRSSQQRRTGHVVRRSDTPEGAIPG